MFVRRLMEHLFTFTYLHKLPLEPHFTEVPGINSLEPKSPKEQFLWSSYTNYVAICFHHIYFSVGSHCRLEVQQTLCGPQLMCVWGSGDKNLMRSPVKASGVSSVKCQWNVKCLSRTLSTVCRLEASHVSWILGFWRTTPSTYQLPSSFLSRPAGITTILRATQAIQTSHTSYVLTRWRENFASCCVCEFTVISAELVIVLNSTSSTRGRMSWKEAFDWMAAPAQRADTNTHMGANVSQLLHHGNKTTEAEREMSKGNKREDKDEGGQKDRRTKKKNARNTKR